MTSSKSLAVASGASNPALANQALATQALASVVDTRQRHWLAAYVKRTYRLDGRRLVLADHQEPLLPLPVFEEDEQQGMRKLLDETDLLASKPATDVIVRGTVRCADPLREHEVAFAIGHSMRRLTLTGPRRATVSRRGAVAFEAPEPFTAIALEPELAYGGFDAYAHAAGHGARPWLARPAWTQAPACGLYAYPRNPIGLGYCVDLDRRRADGIPLPRIEDTADRLRPSQLFVDRLEAWTAHPIPGLVGWVAPHWYPRIDRWLGPLAPRDASVRPLEARLADGADLPVASGPVPRALQGAAPGLAAERLNGDELVVLRGISPRAPELRFNLPDERPGFTMRAPGLDALIARGLLQTVRIDLDAHRISLTWMAGWRSVGPTSATELERCYAEVRWSRGVRS